MSWWSNALYDTCSLITLDKMFLDHPEMEGYFQGIMALEASFRADQLRQDTASRMQPRVTHLDIPAAPDLSKILSAADLPKALAQVDKLVFAAAVHGRLTVVTGDTRLARAITQEGLHVGNIALVLKALVTRQVLSERTCNSILADLAQRRDFILPLNHPQTWTTLRRYTFP